LQRFCIPTRISASPVKATALKASRPRLRSMTTSTACRQRSMYIQKEKCLFNKMKINTISTNILVN
jgi:hypothetical protein